MAIKLDKAKFILSLDTELAWGTRGHKPYQDYYHRTRDIVDKLLLLFQKYKIKATWATIGHLFLDSCSLENNVKHPEIVRPAYSWHSGDWFDVDPVTDHSTDPLWYGKDIIHKIKDCSVKQEIGCHTFSHMIVDDPECTEDCFESELKACRNLAEKIGIDLRSFVFPKNMVAHLSVLDRNNFMVYRGKDKNWYHGFPRIIGKIAHVFDNYLSIPSPAVLPEYRAGLLNIPGSYFYPHRHGWAKFLPVSFRVYKVKSGIRQAVGQKKIFHLWFHPFNIASDEIGLLKGLENIFEVVNDFRKSGLLDNVTMGEFAAQLNINQ